MPIALCAKHIFFVFLLLILEVWELLKMKTNSANITVFHSLKYYSTCITFEVVRCCLWYSTVQFFFPPVGIFRTIPEYSKNSKFFKYSHLISSLFCLSEHTNTMHRFALLQCTIVHAKFLCLCKAIVKENLIFNQSHFFSFDAFSLYSRIFWNVQGKTSWEVL